jgi:hypothetical protein
MIGRAGLAHLLRKAPRPNEILLRGVVARLPGQTNWGDLFQIAAPDSLVKVAKQESKMTEQKKFQPTPAMSMAYRPEDYFGRQDRQTALLSRVKAPHAGMHCARHLTPDRSTKSQTVSRVRP